MTTPLINTNGVQLVQGVQDITSAKAKSNENGQSFMDVMNIAGATGDGKVQNDDKAGRIPTGDNPKQSGTKDETLKVEKGAGKEIKDKDPKEIGKDDPKGTVKEEPKVEKSHKEDQGATITDEEVTEIEEAIADIKVKIEEELGISDEELDQVMETLNLTNTDLLDPKVITDIVAEVKDVTPVDIVANEELSTIVTDLQSEVRQADAGLIQELDITPQEFKNTLAELKNEYEVITPEPKKDEITAEISDEIETDPKIDETKIDKDFSEMVRTPAEAVRKEDQPVRTERMPADTKDEADEVDLTKPVRADEGSREALLSEDGSTKQDNRENPDRRDQEPLIISETKPQTADIFRSEEGEVRITDRASDSSNETTTINNGNVFFQNLTNAVENTLEALGENEAVMARSDMPDAMDLISQISSQVRAVIDHETQTLSMQLNPESLGRLNIELVQKGGQITAQFEAENASVKAALETHVAELKQTLEMRGIRVESVEVSVATHEFEQNFMNGKNEGDQTNEPGGRRRVRSINLSDIGSDESEEELDEEIRITRDMMTANGNSVDYMA